MSREYVNLARIIPLFNGNCQYKMQREQDYINKNNLKEFIYRNEAEGMSENIEKIIMGDSKEKKRTANSSFNRVKRGKSGMVTAVNLMSKAEQREYTKTNDSPNYNVYEEIVPVTYLSQLPLEIRLKCWSKWNETFFLEDIMNIWSVQNIDELNVILEKLELSLLEDSKEDNNGVDQNSDESSFVLSLDDLMAIESDPGYAYDLSGVYDVGQVITQLKSIMEDLKKHQHKCEVQLKIRTL